VDPYADEVYESESPIKPAASPGPGVGGSVFLSPTRHGSASAAGRGDGDGGGGSEMYGEDSGWGDEKTE